MQSCTGHEERFVAIPAIWRCTCAPRRASHQTLVSVSLQPLLALNMNQCKKAHFRAEKLHSHHGKQILGMMHPRFLVCRQKMPVRTYQRCHSRTGTAPTTSQDGLNCSHNPAVLTGARREELCWPTQCSYRKMHCPATPVTLWALLVFLGWEMHRYCTRILNEDTIQEHG